MLITYIIPFLGLLAGTGIGSAFGFMQQAARRQNARLQEAGRLRSGWSVMPGAGGRVALLLLALAFIQFICPLFFQGGTEWWVTGGIGLGYGWSLFRQLVAARSAVDT